MAAPKSTKQLLILLTDAFTTLKTQVAQLLQNGGGGAAVDAYTKAESDAQLTTKASKQEVAAIIGAAPAALDTLAEIATQLRADEVGTAALLATQQQHTQDLTQLVRLPGFTSAQYGKVLALSQAGALVWVAPATGTGGGLAGPVTENDLAQSLLNLIMAPNIALPVGAGLLAPTDADGNLLYAALDQDFVRNLVRDELSSVGGLATWAKPSVQGFDDTNLVAYTGEGPLEYRTTADATVRAFGALASGKYAGTIAVGNFDRAPGYVQARVAATAEKAASAWADSPAFTAAVGNTAPNLLPGSENMDQRPPWNGYNTGFYQLNLPDPLGGNTMFQMTSPFDNACRLVSPDFNLEVGKTYTFSGIFKAVRDDLPYVPDFTIQTALSLATIHLDNGGSYSGAQNATFRTTDLSAQGDAWKDFVLVEMTFVASNTVQHLDMVVSAPNATRTQLWRWQVNAGTTRSTYQPTYL